MITIFIYIYMFMFLVFINEDERWNHGAHRWNDCTVVIVPQGEVPFDPC